MTDSTQNHYPQAQGTRWALLLIFVVGLLARAVFAGLPRVARWDEAAYLAIARNLLAGNGYRELVGAVDLQQPPMVAILAMIGLALRLPLAWAASGPAHLLLGSLVVLPMYGLGREIYGPRVGLMAALLGAIYPALAVSPLYWSTMTEPPYVLFILAGLYATLRCAQSLGGPASASGRPLGWAALMGGAFGLGYLVRPESLVYLAMMLVYLGIVWFASGRHHLSKALASAGIAVAITVLLALPYVLYLHRATGLWLASGKQGVSMDISWAYANNSQAMHDKAAASLDPSDKEILWVSPEGFQKTLTGWIAENPRRFAVLVRTNIRNTWHALFHEDLFTPWVVALMALGLFGQAWTRPRLRRELILLLALVPLAGLWVFFVLSRFLAVDVAIGLIWAAAGLEQLSRWAGDTGKNLLTKAGTTRPASGRRVSIDLLRVLPVAGTVTLLLTGCIGVATNQLPRQPFFRVETARWLSKHVAAGSPVMTRNTETTLYAGLPMVAFPNAAWPQVKAYGQARGARYLVVDEKEIREIRPDLAALVEPNAPNLPPGVILRERIDAGGRSVFVYEFVP